MVNAPWDYPWSSVHAPIAGKSDGMVEVEPLLDLTGDWKAYLSRAVTQPIEELEVQERTERLLWGDSFIEKYPK